MLFDSAGCDICSAAAARLNEPRYWPQGVENKTDEVCALQPACAYIKPFRNLRSD
jgi:hypothetical protein